MNKIKFGIFTWNTQSIKYDISTSNFIDKLYVKLRSNDVIVIGLQEDAINQSQLLNIITNKFINFKLIKEEYLSGWGITTFKDFKDNFNYTPRGLKIGIFKKKKIKLDIHNIYTDKLTCPSIYDWLIKGKGAIAINIETDKGLISFINMHLPFSSKTLVNLKLRYKSMIWQVRCLNYFYEQITQKYKPNWIFLFGDLNFRIQIRNEKGANEIINTILNTPNSIYEFIAEADELQLIFNYSNIFKYKNLIPYFYEGTHNIGPLFLPTSKLKKGRKGKTTLSHYKLGKNNQRVPSWCDRILYKNLNNSSFISCLRYERWDYGNIKMSDHASVIGQYLLYF